MGEPGLVLADEPTGNLDSATGSEILSLLLQLREQRGITIVLATHDAQIASRADRLVRLRDGRVVDDVQVPAALSREQVLQRITGLDAP
jgi:putative ABC transport system ATP-binding protein